MRRFLFSILFLSLVMGSMAKTVRELWVSLPADVVPYLSESKRIELTDYVNLGVQPEVSGLLGDTTRIDTLTTEYMQVRLTAASRLELLSLPRPTGDTLVCLARTTLGPVPESTVTVYTQDWQSVADALPSEMNGTGQADTLFLHRPDTMSTDRYARLRNLAECVVAEARLSPAELTITLCPALPMLCNEEKEEAKAILVQRKYKWDGEKFTNVKD